MRHLRGAAACAVVVPIAFAGIGPARGDDPVTGNLVPTGRTAATDQVARHEIVVVREDSGAPTVRRYRADSAEAAQAAAQRLDAEPGVTADVNAVMTLPDDVFVTKSTLSAEPMSGRQWALRAIHVRPAWRTTSGAGVVVAVVDSGVDETHPELSDRTLPQIDVARDRWTGDVLGHGTHVAGIIAAALDGAGTVGVAPQVRILPVRVLDDRGTSDAATVAKGIIRAVDAEADVINLSLGTESRSRAIDRAVAYATGRGVTVVAAAGNEAGMGNPVEYPAASPGVLAVGSMESDGRVAGYSNHGWYVDLIAPGSGIHSTMRGGRYGADSGTSMAAPHVAAVAALVRSADPRLSGTAVDDVLVRTAQDDESRDGRDDYAGHGLVQADAAVAAARAGVIRATATSGVRLAKLRISDRRVREGERVRFRLKARSKFTDGLWRATPRLTPAHLQIRGAAGRWRELEAAAVRGRGRVRVKAVIPRSGRYRIVVGSPGEASGWVRVRVLPDR